MDKTFDAVMESSKDGIITTTKPGNKTLNEIVTATVYRDENYRVVIQYSHESYLSSDTPTGNATACKLFLLEKGFSDKASWYPGESQLSPLYTNDVEQMRTNARIIGVMYGIIYGATMNNHVVIYSQLSYEVCIAAKCTHQQFIDACKELLRYSGIVQKYLESKNEM
jgi:hypothetical protein